MAAFDRIPGRWTRQGRQRLRARCAGASWHVPSQPDGNKQSKACEEQQNGPPEAGPLLYGESASVMLMASGTLPFM